MCIVTLKEEKDLDAELDALSLIAFASDALSRCKGDDMDEYWWELHTRALKSAMKMYLEARGEV